MNTKAVIVLAAPLLLGACASESPAYYPPQRSCITHVTGHTRVSDRSWIKRVSISAKDTDLRESTGEMILESFSDLGVDLVEPSKARALIRIRPCGRDLCVSVEYNGHISPEARFGSGRECDPLKVLFRNREGVLKYVRARFNDILQG
ncbi:MAG: hypothetical protein KGI41_01200 [Patescibacteria group bacterium]|nr:hypothetical protein [Patescibacteria group bacterium]MDE1965843.1 hypothetical protein [Patescibacteria group bacterium]